MKRSSFLIDRGCFVISIILMGVVMVGQCTEVKAEEEFIINSSNELLNYLEKSGLLMELKLTSDEAKLLIKTLENLSVSYLERPLTETVILNELPKVVRMPAEYEKMQGVLIHWPFLLSPALTTPSQLWQIYREIVKTLVEEGKVYIVVSNKWHQAGIMLYFQQNGISINGNVEFLYIPSHDIWIRDYGPAVVRMGSEQTPVVIDAGYHPPEEPYQKLDDEFPVAFANHFSLPVLRLPLNIEYGNFMTDGKGTAFMTDAIFTRNPKLTFSQLKRLMGRYFGIKRTIILPSISGDYLGHIDLYAKLISDDTILLAKLKQDNPGYQTLEEIALKLSKIKSANGKPYKIIRVSDPEPFQMEGFLPVYRSYLNSLIFNKTVLVPLYGISLDEETLAIYRKALPGYRIIGIDSTELLKIGGTIHCVTHEIPLIFRGEIKYAQ